MKQKTLLFTLSLLLMLPAAIKAQDHDSYNDLVITEYSQSAQNSTTWGYFEVTNMGNDTLDLSKYWMSTSYGNLNNQPFAGGAQKATLGRYPGQVLLPGQSYVWAKAGENDQLDQYGNRRYPNDYLNYQMPALATYICFVRQNLDGTILTAQIVHGLYTRADTNLIPDGIADSVQIDQFWLSADERGSSPNAAFPIAGVISSNPINSYLWVRKPKFKKSNPDFNFTRGTNIDDSEWLPLPKQNGINDVLFTTIGNHFNQKEFAVTSKSKDIVIDQQNMVINLPFDIAKDSIFRNFSYGKNMAWRFFQGPDTASYYIAEGDSVEFYAVGDQITTFRFAFKPSNKPTNFVKVKPLIYKNNNNVYTRRYTVSDGIAPMDTIGQIPFGTPLDTLEDYIVIDESATFEYIWVDGKVRPEAKNGDILRVTSGGLSKDYRLSLWPYQPSSNSNLRTVVFPGLELWENPATYLMSDTMRGFNATAYFYIINLPQYVKVSPAVIATAAHANSRVYVKRAKNLDGSDEDRTLTIKVMAEDDSTESVYNFLLNVDRENAPVVGTPFITDIAGQWASNAGTCIQIFNPTDEVLNISDYMLMFIHQTKTDFVNFIQNEIAANLNEKELNKYVLRPGFWINDDINGDPYFVNDYTVPSVELEPKDVFVGQVAPSYPSFVANVPDAIREQVDILFGSYGTTVPQLQRSRAWWQANRWNNTLHPYVDNDPNYTGETDFLLLDALGRAGFDKGTSFALYKINNDSILNGTKPVYKDFFKDFELVDIVNGISTVGTPWTLYNNVHGIDSAIHMDGNYIDGGVYRSPEVYTGNPVDLAAFGTKGHPGEWISYGMEYNEETKKFKKIQQNNEKGDLGSVQFGRPRLNNHTMITSAHIPYLVSTVYQVSKGLSTAEKIYGVLNNTSVTSFLANVIKLDTAMKIAVTSSTGIPKDGADVLLQGDKVTSTAANGLTSVTYNINVGALSANTALTAKAGAEFSISGTSVINVPFGITLKNMMDYIEGPELATVVVTDGEDYIIPFETYAADTMINERVDALVSNNYVIEVTAQDGITVAKYNIVFKDEAKLYVLSTRYTVVEDEGYINFVGTVNTTNFLANLIPSPGATIRVLNKLNQERELGILQYHDKLEVRKGNAVRIYYIRMLNETDENADAVKKTNKLETSVYPNPSAGNITISGLKNATDIRVMNISGQTIKSLKVTGESMLVNLNASAGIYFIEMMNNKKIIETQKVVIE